MEIVRDTLAWCAVINLGLLLWWFLFLTVAHDWTYRLHGKWFKMSRETFDAIHYGGMAAFKFRAPDPMVKYSLGSLGIEEPTKFVTNKPRNFSCNRVWRQNIQN